MTRRWSRFLFLFFLAGAIPLLAQQPPRPADPLTQAEIDRATAAAMKTATARLTGERLEVVSVELANVKPAGRSTRDAADEIGRHAIVTVFGYARNEGLAVLVDLRSMATVNFASVAPQAVPLGPREVDAAARLALANDQVRRLARADQASFVVEGTQSRTASRNVIEGLRVIAGNPADPCSVDRCVDLFFRVNDRYIVGSRVTVNLTRQTVSVQTTEGGTPR